MTEKEKKPNKKSGLKPDAQAQIGDKLKEVYADVVNEPVPDRFLELLDQLEKGDRSDKKSS